MPVHAKSTSLMEVRTSLDYLPAKIFRCSELLLPDTMREEAGFLSKKVKIMDQPPSGLLPYGRGF